MFQAIETKYLGPTNTKGGRILARAQAGSITVAYDYALNTDQNHERAADKLAAKLEWVGEHHSRLIGGGNVKGDGYVFVFVSTERTDWEKRSAQAYGEVR